MTSIIDKMDILSTWRRLSSYPFGKWLFSKVVGWAAPYSGSIGARIDQLEPGKCVVRIRDRHRLRNHLGSVHAIALINLGEFSSGLALYAMMPVTHRGIISAISMHYVKKARGSITARCQLEPLQWTEADQNLVLRSELYDQSGETVASAEVTWRVGAKRRPG
jgi:acyl-coenzyme A thioesterase PaaI-like protein